MRRRQTLDRGANRPLLRPELIERRGPPKIVSRMKRLTHHPVARQLHRSGHIERVIAQPEATRLVIGRHRKHGVFAPLHPGRDDRKRRVHPLHLGQHPARVVRMRSPVNLARLHHEEEAVRITLQPHQRRIRHLGQRGLPRPLCVTRFAHPAIAKSVAHPALREEAQDTRTCTLQTVNVEGHRVARSARLSRQITPIAPLGAGVVGATRPAPICTLRREELPAAREHHIGA